MENQKNRMRIKRVKRAKKSGAERLEIFYEHLVNGNWDEGSRKSFQKPAPEFYQALDALAIHAAELHEFPQEYAKKLSVYGVNYSYSGEDEVMGATMAVKMEMEFADKPTILTTPFKKSYPEEGVAIDEAQYLSEECVNALWELARQAELYVNGESAQIALDFDQAAAQEPVEEELPEGFLDDEEPFGDGMGNVVNFPPAASSNETGTHGLVI